MHRKQREYTIYSFMIHLILVSLYSMRHDYTLLSVSSTSPRTLLYSLLTLAVICFILKLRKDIMQPRIMINANSTIVTSSSKL